MTQYQTQSRSTNATETQQAPRKNDEANEKVITSYLMQYMYGRLYAPNQVEVVEDKARQVKGADVIVHTPNGDEIHDIKAQSSKQYINNPRPTYAMEILTNDKYGVQQLGWFVNNNLNTQYYTLCWINKAKVDEQGMIHSPNDIQEMEVMVVDKAALKQYISTLNYSASEKCSDELFIELARDLRYDGDTEPLPVARGMKLRYSALQEHPVSLVVRKDILERFADRYMVRPNELEVLAQNAPCGYIADAYAHPDMNHQMESPAEDEQELA